MQHPARGSLGLCLAFLGTCQVLHSLHSAWERKTEQVWSLAFGVMGAPHEKSHQKAQFLVWELATTDSLQQAVAGVGTSPWDRFPGEHMAQLAGDLSYSDCSLLARCKACPFPREDNQGKRICKGTSEQVPIPSWAHAHFRGRWTGRWVLGDTKKGLCSALLGLPSGKE